MLRYVPAHHPLCSCELCMLATRIREDGGRMQEDERRRAVAWMNQHGKLTQPVRERREQPAPAVQGLPSLVGKTARFRWAQGFGPGLGEQSWFCANEAHVQAFDRGAFLLDIKHVPMRWWPLRAFAFIEPLEPVAPVQPLRTPERAAPDWRA